MSAITNKSVRNFLKSTLSKLKLTDNEFNKLRDILDKAQYDCCQVITVYWINSEESGSNATPQAYQIRFKDADGNTIHETDVNGTSPQKFKLPQGQYQICNNVITSVTNGADGSGFEVDGSEGFMWFNSGESAPFEYCDTVNGLADLNQVYFVLSIDGSPI